MYKVEGVNELDIIRHMDKEIFKENLIKTIEEITTSRQLEYENSKFIIAPVVEKNKMLDGQDNMMRLVMLSEDNIGGKKLTIEECVKILATLSPRVPIWINVSFQEIERRTAIFKLETSVRVRKPSLLRNAETGHPPFKAIYKMESEG